MPEHRRINPCATRAVDVQCVQSMKQVHGGTVSSGDIVVFRFKVTLFARSFWISCRRA